MTARLRDIHPVRVSGAVSRATGHEVQVRGLRVRVGDPITITTADGPRPAEIVAIDPDGARALILGETTGIARGDRILPRQDETGVILSDMLVGRVVDGMCRPLDGGPQIEGAPATLDHPLPHPLERRRIDQVLPVGVRALDTMVTAGRGQRLGIFGGSGVGKSTLLGMMARGTAADVVVLAMIGERGREVREFLEDDLGPEGRAKTVAVVATSDQPPLLRMRAGRLATRIAEWFADQGKDVLLLFDSLTRLAMAQREVGLAAGEPPTARGYTPSVFTMMPGLLERAGPRKAGTVTGFYTVLVEGDDLNDPIADAARSILDGHIVLDRRLSIEGRWPAIDPLASLSRLADRLIQPDHQAIVGAVRSALAAADEVRDLVEVGAYMPGTNPRADAGLAAKPDIVEFLKQKPGEASTFEASWGTLTELAGRLNL